MHNSKFAQFITTLLAIVLISNTQAQTIFNNDIDSFRVSGYLRTGFGFSEGGETQADFQMPGTLNKYSIGNQADTYGEVEFDYSRYLNKSKTKSLDAVWMVSLYEPFGSEGAMSFNFTEQLYLRANNLLGMGESIWVGRRFYDRHAIYMLDRQWLNPGQGGWGGGIENLLNRGGNEDIKIAAWGFINEDVISYKNGAKGELKNYTADIRWVNRAVAENIDLNIALNYNYRVANKELGYDGYDGYALTSWIDYERRNITNTTAVVLRQGANIPINHWNGKSQSENPAGDNQVLFNLKNSRSLELNNDFLYDDKERFAINATCIFVAQDFGTDPYNYVDGQREYLDGRGSRLYWLSGAARGMYYVSKIFRPTLEYSYEYVNNTQQGAEGSLNRITFTPELSLSKGYYSRPVLRPFISYALWSKDLMGHIGTTPSGAPYANATSGFNAGLQFEIWW